MVDESTCYSFLYERRGEKESASTTDWFLDAVLVCVIRADFHDDLKTTILLRCNSGLLDTSSTNKINRKGILHIRFLTSSSTKTLSLRCGTGSYNC